MRVLMQLLFVCFFCSSFAFANVSDHTFGNKSQEGSIKILDAKELGLKTVAQLNFGELSDLTLKDNLLYMISDKGILYSFYLHIQNDTIQSLQPLDAYKLRTKSSNELKKSYADAEGLSFIGKNLLVSFERKARVELFSKKGKKIENVEIHEDLQNTKMFREKNKGLEAVTYNQKYGVVTAPEINLKNRSRKEHTLFSQTKEWSFPANGNLSALEFFDDDRVIILQKQVNQISRKWLITLSMIDLTNSKYEILAVFDTRDGWNLDNFEGLAKVSENKFLMISDNQDSFFQKTLLVLFEVLRN